LAWAFNWITGGTDKTPGAYSPTPDSIEYVFDQFTGGIGREINRAQGIVGAISRGEEIPTYKLPLISRFHGTTEGQAQEATRFYNNIRKMNIHENEIKDLRDKRKPLTEYLRENPEARYYLIANKAETSIRNLMSRKRTMQANDASQASLKQIDSIISNRMKQLNDLLKRTA
jgi:hypothetical protein